MQNSKGSEALDKLLEALGFARMTTEQMYPREYFFEKPSVRLQLNYCMIRFLERRMQAKIGFKTTERDPRIFFNANLIPERNEIDLHIRMPLRDEWHNLIDYVDIDIYFPISEIAKIVKLIEENQTQ